MDILKYSEILIKIKMDGVDLPDSYRDIACLVVSSISAN